MCTHAWIKSCRKCTEYRQRLKHAKRKASRHATLDYESGTLSSKRQPRDFEWDEQLGKTYVNHYDIPLAHLEVHKARELYLN